MWEYFSRSITSMIPRRGPRLCVQIPNICRYTCISHVWTLDDAIRSWQVLFGMISLDQMCEHCNGFPGPWCHWKLPISGIHNCILAPTWVPPEEMEICGIMVLLFEGSQAGLMVWRLKVKVNFQKLAFEILSWETLWDARSTSPAGK